MSPANPEDETNADQPAFRSGFAALVGRPNVGKSSLLNALVGEKVAIVSRRWQTTRRRLLGIRTTSEAQVIFIDTPGVHQPRHLLGRHMVQTALRAMREADVVLLVVDVSRSPTEDDRRVAERVAEAGSITVLVLNKVDLLPTGGLAAAAAPYQDLITADAVVATAAIYGQGLDELWAEVVARLPEGPAYYPADQVTDQSEQFIAGELVREAALRHLGDEVPHGLEVMIEEWEVRPNGVLYVAARVVVERESHKAIVIGRHGSMLVRIGSEARQAIEQRMGRRVYLDLQVRVRPRWRNQERELRRLGYDVRI